MWLYAIAYTTTLVATAFAQNSTTLPASNLTIECFGGLKMFVSRGISEPLGVGLTGEVTEVIARKLNGSNYEANPYPASGDNPNYFISVANGTAILKQLVLEYVEACPESKMALIGYSQVTSNILCGMPAVWALYGGGDTTRLDGLRTVSNLLPRNITRNVVAIVLFGDTTHRSESSHNRGDSTRSGVFWRADADACESYGDHIRSYCTAGDPFCDVGPHLNATAHLTYVADYSEEVIEYVVEQYENAVEAGVGRDSAAAEEADDGVAAQKSSGSWTWSISSLVGMAVFLTCGML